MAHPDNPFLREQLPDGRWIGYVDAKSRIYAVEKFNLHECRQALGVNPLQKEVIRALEKRIRRLEQA